MKFCLAVLLLFTLGNVMANDTLHVTTHDKTIVVTDPATGYKSYRHWGVFPNKNVEIRKIILHVKFGCPDSLRCADWDYLDFITIKRIGGLNGENKDVEIGRMLTPYGGAFSKNWEFDWQADVSDFSLFLRDSVEIEYYHSGYEPNHDRGWKITLDFEIIKGTPTLLPVSITKVYGGAYKYGDSISIEEQLKPMAINKHRDASLMALKISQTGHGMNPNDGCGEFCSKKREIIINGKSIDQRALWKKCGDNPLYPQAGTWLIDRAYWCPGYLQPLDEYYFQPMAENVVDVNMETYFAHPNQAVESINAYVVQYKRKTNGPDVSILDIIVPSGKQIHSRKNPSGFDAQVIIKNLGDQALTSLNIEYGTEGFPQKKWLWKGHISIGAQDTIILPGNIDCSINGKDIFNVSLHAPNNKKDIYLPDNNMSSVFENPPVHGNNIVLAFKTNNQPSHNNIHIINHRGQTVYKKSFTSIDSNKVILDTLKLPEGRYELKLYDKAGDGLEFWFNNRGGSGYFRLQDIDGNLLKSFESDFGSEIRYAFDVNNDVNLHSRKNVEPFAMLYPTRTTGQTTLHYFNGEPGDVRVQIITDEGAILVEDHQYKNLKSGTFHYDVSYRPAQRYYLKLYLNGVLKYNKRIRVENRQR